LKIPADPNSTALESVFEDLTAYKNRNGGIWGRGEMHVFRNVKLADNAMGFTSRVWRIRSLRVYVTGR
jgi:hypothetical protein